MSTGEAGQAAHRELRAAVDDVFLRHRALAVDLAVLQHVLHDERLLDADGIRIGDKPEAARHARAVAHDGRVLDLAVLPEVRRELLRVDFPLHALHTAVGTAAVGALFYLLVRCSVCTLGTKCQEHDWIHPSHGGRPAWWSQGQRGGP